MPDKFSAAKCPPDIPWGTPKNPLGQTKEVPLERLHRPDHKKAYARQIICCKPPARHPSSMTIMLLLCISIIIHIDYTLYSIHVHTVYKEYHLKLTSNEGLHHPDHRMAYARQIICYKTPSTHPSNMTLMLLLCINIIIHIDYTVGEVWET